MQYGMQNFMQLWKHFQSNLPKYLWKAEHLNWSDLEVQAEFGKHLILQRSTFGGENFGNYFSKIDSNLRLGLMHVCLQEDTNSYYFLLNLERKIWITLLGLRAKGQKLWIAALIAPFKGYKGSESLRACLRMRAILTPGSDDTARLKKGRGRFCPCYSKVRSTY